MSFADLRRRYHEEMAIEKFVVLGRSGIEKYEETRPHMVISVSDPLHPAPSIPINENRLGLLRLQFYDLERYRPELEERFKDIETPLFTTELANKILDFYHEHRSKSEVLVVNCEAGISRSSAIAAALCKSADDSDAYFFKMFLPNRRVYSMILAEHFRRSLTNPDE